MTRFATSLRKTSPIKLAVFLAALAPSVALADWPVSANERASVVTAMAQEGCSGGHIEKDDGGYDVEHATCNGTRNFDLHLTSSFDVVSKHWDD